MRVLLMRHCEAEAGADSDPDRPLTASALQRLRSRAEALPELFEDVEGLVSSPWRRAHETAVALRPFLPRVGRCESSEALLPQADTIQMLNLLEPFAMRGSPAFLVVGHQPLLGRAISLLCDGPGGVSFDPEPGAVAIIDLEWPAAGLGTLRRWYRL